MALRRWWTVTFTLVGKRELWSCNVPGAGTLSGFFHKDMSTATHINLDDPRYKDAAGQILSRHDALQPEANITSAVRQFLVLTGLARNEEIIEENPPTDASRRAVDLTALDTFIEFKRRIGTASGGAPDPENVRQLDEYLEQSAANGRVRMGVLTDGRRWLLRWPGAGPVRLTRFPTPSPWMIRKDGLTSTSG